MIPASNMMMMDRTVAANSTTTTTNSVLTLAKPLAKCGVLYIGSAVPETDAIGIDSVQSPLLKRYSLREGALAGLPSSIVHGMDAVLIVRENGIEISFSQDSCLSLFYPIRSLLYCASVRYIPGRHSSSKGKFVPLDSSKAARYEGDSHPPVFCVVFRRTRNVGGDECHCFIAKTKQSALVLVQACFAGYTRTNSSQSSPPLSKVPLYIKGQAQTWFEVNDEIKVVEAPTSSPITDFMTNPRSAGFFYSTAKTKIDSWQLWDEEKTGQLADAKRKRKKRRHRSRRRRSSSDNGSFDSTTEYFRKNVPKEILSANKLGDQFALASKLESSVDSSNVDPYFPAPNLVKVEHIKDPRSGANVFIRWFDCDAEPRSVHESDNMRIEERSIHNHNHKQNRHHHQDTKPKGILRNQQKSGGKFVIGNDGDDDDNDDNDESYRISKAYFEDKSGRIHHFSDRKINKIRKRRTSLSDEVRRLYIDGPSRHSANEGNGKYYETEKLPLGAKVPSVNGRWSAGML